MGLLAALILIPLSGAVALAQTQFGTVSGRVQDSSGAVVPAAKVVLTSTATNARQEVQTNEEGLYLFANVAAGTYEVTVEKESFKKTVRRITVEVAQRLAVDFQLQVGQVTEIITVQEQAVAVNTVSGDLSRTITPAEVVNLPLLSRNPYSLVGLAAGAVQTLGVLGDARGGTTEDTSSGGVAINGSRTSSINYLLDGSENNSTFTAGIAQSVPLDAVQEFRIQTNNMTAEFGRNAVVTNVITKSGSNALHGSAYEYYRGSALASSSFNDNANGTPKSRFVRNQFGASAGGPILKDKTFFFGSFEGTRVRSAGNFRSFVPTQALLDNSSAATNTFLTAFGGLPTSNCADGAMTAQSVWENTEGNPTYGTVDPATGNVRGLYSTGNAPNAAGTGLIPAATQIFCRSTIKAPIDTGGGAPQNTWLATGRIDHQINAATNLQVRYAFSKFQLAEGTSSLSPFEGFNTGIKAQNQNVNLTLTHLLTPRLFTESRVAYARDNQVNPLGAADGTVPCWQYLNLFTTPTGDPVVLPGYLPQFCRGFSIPSGGPKNVYQFYEGMTWSHGAHTLKWGGQYVHIRDNHTFGAFQNHFNLVNTAQGIINGQVDSLSGAINPKGRFPLEQYQPAVDGPFVAPSFTRHFRYHEWSFYGEDSWKLNARLTLTGGLRWEYFGVLHSPKDERFLDANLYLDAVRNLDPNKTIFEQVRDARFSRTNNFFNQDWNNFAPRLGFAYDVFGNSRTVVRGGYGLFYDRNFGNALFNAIQNFPNYAVITVNRGGLPSFPANANVTVSVNQFDTLNQVTAGGALTLTGSARMLDREMVTAYSQQWNLTVEHDVLGKGVIASLSYVGTKGDKLYSLNNLNQLGGCLLAPTINATCDPTTPGRASRLNQSGVTGMNRRSNEGFSRYHGLSAEVKTRELLHTGLLLNANYTWAHSIDNSSSFFGDSAFEAFFGFGFRDPFNPALDRGNSSNDIRHRLALSWNWALPWYKQADGWQGQVLRGWNLSGVVQAQTGGTFSVYDGSGSSQCNFSVTNFCFPVLAGGALPSRTETEVAGTPNTFTLYNLGSAFQTQEDFCAANSLNTSIGTFGGPGSTAGSQLACTAALISLRPDLQSPRNLFRTPGIWNVDLAILKDFRLPWEGKGLQFRAEFFNAFNHSNMYAISGQNVFAGAGSTVVGSRGLRNDGVVERRNVQMALRLTW